MTTMKVRAWTNETPPRFEEYTPGTPLDTAVDLVVPAFDESDFHGVLDKTWAIGNRMMSDANGKDWPVTVRSLSVGDVIAIAMPGGREWFWSVARFGFEAIDPASICDCGKGDYCPEFGIDFGPAEVTV